jgi:Skp family chaperone for outer membrane proteins
VAAVLRHLRRIYRLYGIRPFALPSIALLAVAVLFDRHAGDYSTQREEAERLGKQVERMREKVARQKEFERVIDEGRPAYARMSGRVVSAADVAAAQGELQERVRSLLLGLVAEDVAVVPVTTAVSPKSGAIAVDASFAGVPQQLVRLQQKLEQAPQALRITEIDIQRRVDADAPERIRAKVRVAAWFVSNELNGNAGKPADSRGRR